MALKRGRKGLFKKVVKELEMLFRKERSLIPQWHPDCPYENKILLGCELLRSYLQQKANRDNEPWKCNYPGFVICGLFEKGNRPFYGDFSKLGLEKGFTFIGEYQWTYYRRGRLNLDGLNEMTNG